MSSVEVELARLTAAVEGLQKANETEHTTISNAQKKSDEKIDRMDETIRGNGKPGLVQQTSENTKTINRWTAERRVIYTAIVGSVVLAISTWVIV